MSDQQLVVLTLRKASRIIANYLESGSRDADETITQLITVVGNQGLWRALDRLEKGHGLRVVK